MSAPESNGVVWKDPPAGAASHGNRRWMTRLAPLLAHPNRWAVVHTTKSAGAAVQNLRRRQFTIPPGHWEFAHAGDEVYARYLGLDDGADQ